jgi:hypothetical protein
MHHLTGSQDKVNFEAADKYSATGFRHRGRLFGSKKGNHPEWKVTNGPFLHELPPAALNDANVSVSSHDVDDEVVTKHGVEWVDPDWKVTSCLFPHERPVVKANDNDNVVSVAKKGYDTQSLVSAGKDNEKIVRPIAIPSRIMAHPDWEMSDSLFPHELETIPKHHKSTSSVSSDGVKSTHFLFPHELPTIPSDRIMPSNGTDAVKGTHFLSPHDIPAWFNHSANSSLSNMSEAGYSHSHHGSVHSNHDEGHLAARPLIEIHNVTDLVNAINNPTAGGSISRTSSISSSIRRERSLLFASWDGVWRFPGLAESEQGDYFVRDEEEEDNDEEDGDDDVLQLVVRKDDN